MKENQVLPGNHYVNLKTRNIYKVLGFTKHTETLETLVRYQRVNVLPDDDESLVEWSRPLALFALKFEHSP